MQNTYKKRICIVSRSLSEGGADRVAAMQSIFLNKLGYKVYLVTVLDAISYSFEGELLNLGKLKSKDNSIFGRLKRLFIFRRFLKLKKIDLIIDHRVRSKRFSEYVISGFIYSKSVIYMVHSYDIAQYFPPIKWLTKLLYQRAKYIVSVSEGITRAVKNTYGFNNVITVHNPVDFNHINSLKNKKIIIKDTYIMWYGRLHNAHKNLDLLVAAYQKSELPKKNINLIIMGKGKDKLTIEKKINSLNLQDKILLLPFSNNPFKYVNQAKFTVLSSNFEGFPMAILESLACGIPVVTVKYKSYEDGLIKHKHNGIIVENHNALVLADAFNLFVENQNLYLSCKANAIKSVKHLNVVTIAKQWQTLINT